MVGTMAGRRQVAKRRNMFYKKKLYTSALYLQVGSADGKLGTKEAFDDGYDDLSDIFL